MDMDFPTTTKFLNKLWDLVNNPVYNDLICWDVSGKSFHVVDQTRFAKEIIPTFFKHNNMNSFVRQLNMYGFRKVNPCIETSMREGRDEVTFAHKYFLHGQRHLLENIKRNTSRNQKHDISEIYDEVSNMKTQLDSMTDTLENLRVENECLWKEVVNLRQKHARQQQVVSKLVQFFISLVNKDHNNGSLKRKYNLMIKGPNEDSVPMASDVVAQVDSNLLTSLSTLKPTSNALQGLKSLTNKGKPTLVYLKNSKNPAEENKSLVAKVVEPRILNIQKNLSPEFPVKALEPLSITLPQTISLSDLIDEPELYNGDFDLFKKYGLPSSEGSSSKELLTKNDSRNMLRDFDRDEFLRSQNNFQNNLQSFLSVLDTNQQIDLSDASLLALQDETDENRVSPTKKQKLDDNSHDLTVMHYNPEDHTFTDSLISEFSGGDALYPRQDDNDNDAYYDDFL